MSIVFRELFPKEESIGDRRKKWFEEYTGQPEIIISYRKDSDDDNSHAVCGFTCEKGFECFMDSLKYVAFDDNIRIIMGMAFQGNKFLKKAVFSKTMDYIGMNAFDGCISLKSVELPKGLGGIPESIPVCRYGDEKMISELLRDIKIQHQSGRSILPKIVRKALKLSDYYEALRDIDIIDNENE